MKLSNSREHERVTRILNNAHEMAQKKHDDPAEQTFHALIHAAVAFAGDQGRERSAVAAALGIALDTLNTRLKASDRCFTSADIARMMMDPSVLGKPAHAWLISRMAIVAGRQILMPLNDGPLDDLSSEVIDVMDAGGFLASRARTAMDDASDGGRAITDDERRGIAAAAGMVAQESLDLVREGVGR